MTMAADTEFWLRLSRCINDALRRSGDNNVRYLWMDGVVPESVAPRLDQNSVSATAYVSEDSGKSFIHYRLTLRLSKSTAAAYDEGEWDRLLPDADSAEWLTVNRTAKEIDVRYPR